MDWSLLLLIFAFAALLQLAFFWYYLRLGQRSNSVYPRATGESSDNASVGSANQPVNPKPSAEAADGDACLVCQTCGFENPWDSTFTFCANCVTRLGR